MNKGWKTAPLSDLATFYSGGTPNKEQPAYWDGSIPWVTVKDMKAIRLNNVGKSLTEVGADNVRIVPAGTVLVLVRGMKLFKDLPIVLCDRSVAFNQDIKALVPKEGVDSEYLALVLIAHKSKILRHVDKAGHGTGRISSELLRSISLPIPSLPEQQKIANVLRTWIETLEKFTALREAKTQQLEGLTNKLIHCPHMKRQSLGKNISEISIRNHDQRIKHVLSVTNSAGFVPAKDHFAHRVASADLSNYKVVQRGQYAYNPSRINVGSIARLNDYEIGVLSPMYVVLQMQDMLDSDYFGHWLRSAETCKRIATTAQGSVRHTVSFTDLCSIPIPLPPLSEQLAIARTLTTAMNEISLLDQENKALDRQKRGLMRKLLTGEWRTTVENR